MAATKIIGTTTTYIGTDPDEHPYLAGCSVRVLGVIKRGADPAVDEDDIITLRSDDDIERAGVTRFDRVEIQPWVVPDGGAGRWSPVTSDPLATDLACFVHLRSRRRR